MPEPGEWLEPEHNGEVDKLSTVDRLVRSAGLNRGFASALGLGSSSLVWAGFSAGLFGHGLGKAFPLSLLATQSLLALLCFVVSAPLNRGTPAILSSRLLHVCLPAAIAHAGALWSAARVFGAYGA
ncbi:hypothetical protein T492DRAFT_878882 [Pavlovales sp. CCMP2436]|nr:hypothetical protein T492DRAFT_878882 [Pavlovales sp. CCMP2436]